MSLEKDIRNLLLVIFWLPMMIIQFKAFAKGLTPYPKKAKWFCVPIGAVPALALSVILARVLIRTASVAGREMNMYRYGIMIFS